MNRVFKVIWNRTKGCYVVVAETAKNMTKRSSLSVVFSKMVGATALAVMLTGVMMLGFMYAAVAPWVWGSLNPVVNEHLVYALVLILIPLTSAGDTLGLGRWWKGLGLVKKLPFLI